MSSKNTVQVVKDLKQSLAKELDAGDSSDNERCTDIINQLDSLPINLGILSETLVGTVVSKFKSHSDAAIAAKAKALVKKWKQLAKQGGLTNSSSSSAKPPAYKPTTANTTLKLKNGRKLTPAKISRASSSSIATSNGENESTEWDHLPPLRKNTAKKLHQILALSNDSLSKSGIHPDAVKTLISSRASEVESACHIFSKGMKTNYLDKVRSLISNLKKNMDLREKVILGSFSGETLISLSPEQLATKEKTEERSAVVARLKDSSRLDWEDANEDKINEMCGIKGDLLLASLFTCGRCKSTKTTSTQKQTRSADEPMTVFVLCLNCGNRWKC